MAETTNERVARLLEHVKTLPPMTPEQKRAQAISFAYGNCHIENPRITREMVEQAYDRLYPDWEARQ